ncbi:MAG: hypothetical protein AAFP17_07885 [Pseudomonadota bacterium]
MSHPTKPGGLAGPLNGLSIGLSLVAMVLLAPRLFPLVEDAVWQELHSLYAPSTARLRFWGAEIASWPLTYFAARMLIMAGFMALSLAIARRRM